MSVNIISASETGCFMSYLCSCSGGAARVECSSSGGDDTAVKSGVVCAPAVSQHSPAHHTPTAPESQYKLKLQTGLGQARTGTNMTRLELCDHLVTPNIKQ